MLLFSLSLALPLKYTCPSYPLLKFSSLPSLWLSSSIIILFVMVKSFLILKQSLKISLQKYLVFQDLLVLSFSFTLSKNVNCKLLFSVLELLGSSTCSSNHVPRDQITNSLVTKSYWVC